MITHIRIQNNLTRSLRLSLAWLYVFVNPEPDAFPLTYTSHLTNAPIPAILSQTDGLEYRPKKKRASLTRARSAGLLRPHELADIAASQFHPKYRVYNAENQRKTLVVFECSPGAKRRSSRRLPLGVPPGNIESVV